MRIPSGKTDQLIFFVALDSTDRVTRKTGLSSFTVYRSRNGGTATVYTTPTVAELSSSNMPGVYSLAIDEDTTIASGSDSEEMALHITCATMAPVTRTIELYRRDTTSGATSTAQTGDNFARLGAPAGASVSADVAATKALLPAALVGGRIDASIGAMASGVLTATAIAADAITDAKVASDVTIASVTGAVGSVTGAVGSVTGNVGGNVTGSVGSVATGGIAAASFAAGAIDAAAIAANAIGASELAADAVTEIQSGLATASALATAQTSLDDLPTNAELATALGTADDAVLASVAALSIPTANQNADALLDRADAIETGLTPRGAIRLQSSALVGKVSGGGTGTETFRNAVQDSKNRIVATVDSAGNRTAITATTT